MIVLPLTVCPVLSLSAYEVSVEILTLNASLQKCSFRLNLHQSLEKVYFFFQLLVQVLVLAPTRELANQVAKDFKDITRKLSVACFYGGTSYQSQSE